MILFALTRLIAFQEECMTSTPRQLGAPSSLRYRTRPLLLTAIVLSGLAMPLSAQDTNGLVSWYQFQNAAQLGLDTTGTNTAVSVTGMTQTVLMLLASIGFCEEVAVS